MVRPTDDENKDKEDGQKEREDIVRISDWLGIYKCKGEKGKFDPQVNNFSDN